MPKHFWAVYLRAQKKEFTANSFYLLHPVSSSSSPERITHFVYVAFHLTVVLQGKVVYC